MIQIGASNSAALFALLDQQAIELDYITVYGSQSMDVLQRAVAYRPVLLHDVSNTFWLNYADPFADIATVTKARTMLDWRPGFTLEAGLTKTIQWYREFFQQKDGIDVARAVV